MSQTGAAPPTPVLPARLADGWWTGHARYRNYMIFTATGLVIAAADVLLLLAFRALGRGVEAWRGFLGVLGSPPGLLLGAVLFVGVVYFSQRFARVGAKPLSVKVGPLPAIHPTVILVVQVGGVVAVFALLMVLLSGAIGI